MKFKHAHGFVCQGCEQQVPIDRAGLADDHKIYLLGRCKDCASTVAVDIEKLITALLEGSSSNGKGN